MFELINKKIKNVYAKNGLSEMIKVISLNST